MSNVAIGSRASSLKMGRKPARHDIRTLKLVDYVTPGLPPPPDAVTWSAGVTEWPMYMNDQIGDCTCAAAGHQIQAWTSDGQQDEVTVPDAAILSAYEQITGYDPADPSTDQGAVELDVLRFWRRFGIGHHRIGAFAKVSVSNKPLIQSSIHLFGGLYVGLSLPLSAQQQAVWDTDGGFTDDEDPGSWGGHAVPILDYDCQGLTCVTWGQTMRMTWAFFFRYCEEAYAVLSRDFLGVERKAPNGFDIAALRQDLNLVANP